MILLDNLNATIDLWMDELEKYNFEQLCTKLAITSWSLGQVYTHLINDTTYYIEQIRICVSNNDNVKEEASPVAKQMFLNNAFPDQIIEGAPENVRMPQAESKEYLKIALSTLKSEFNILAKAISTTPFKGKTKHPGLDYFDANEWLQFADMHFRHHLRQKKRIDQFLRNVRSLSK